MLDDLYSGCALADDDIWNELLILYVNIYCVAFVYVSKWPQYFIVACLLLIFKYTVAGCGLRECTKFHHSKISLFSCVINCNQHWFAASWKVQRFSVFLHGLPKFCQQCCWKITVVTSFKNMAMCNMISKNFGFRVARV